MVQKRDNKIDQVIDFKRLYTESVNDVYQFWTPSMQREIARHCHPWRQEVMDFEEYLLASSYRFEVALELILNCRNFKTICDMGGFFGVFPLVLSRMGYSVSMTEALKYYSQSFDPLFEFLSHNGVNIVDFDPFGDEPYSGQDYDVVTAMAVLEHFPHSPKVFLDNAKIMTASKGLVYIEVPNIAYWPKRISLLRGNTPLVAISDIYRSSTPFIGHHHEYTLHELNDLAALSSLNVLDSKCFNYSFRGPLIKRLISDPLLTTATILPTMRECIAVLSSPDL